MSLQAMVAVIERCPESKGEYLALLAIANRANERGEGVWYDKRSLKRLAFEARMTERNLQIVIDKLLRKGRLSIMDMLGPQGREMLQINLPGSKLTPELWDATCEARVSEKRQQGKTRLGKTRAPRNVEPSAENENFSQPAPLTFLAPGSEKFSHFSEKFSRKAEKFSHQIGVLPAPGAAHLPPYSPVHNLVQVVIDVASDARAETQAGEPDPAGGDMPFPCDHFFLVDEKEKTIELLGDDDFDELFGPDQPGTLDAGHGTPDGVAADAAGLAGEFHSLSNATEGQEPETATDLEKVPPARREQAGPGSPVHTRLLQLCGGAVKTPNLPVLLGELTRAGNPRNLWLTLTLGEIEDANVLARAAVARGEAVFRTALIDALDELVDGVPKPTPQAQDYRPGWLRQEEAGSLDLSTKPSSPFRKGDRVRHGVTLGTVLGFSSDARQITVDIELDSGEVRTILPAEFPLYVLAPDAPPAPRKVTQLTIGGRWQLSTGEIVTVVRVDGLSPVTSDGTTWPPFGPKSLSRQATSVLSGNAHGAA